MVIFHSYVNVYQRVIIKYHLDHPILAAPRFTFIPLRVTFEKQGNGSFAASEEQRDFNGAFTIEI